MRSEWRWWTKGGDNDDNADDVEWRGVSWLSSRRLLLCVRLDFIESWDARNFWEWESRRRKGEEARKSRDCLLSKSISISWLPNNNNNIFHRLLCTERLMMKERDKLLTKNYHSRVSGKEHIAKKYTVVTLMSSLYSWNRD